MKLVPNCISYPSFVSPAGYAIIPAFSMRMCSLEEGCVVIFAAAALIDENDVKSICRKHTFASGLIFLTSPMTATGFEMSKSFVSIR